jgi:2-polyprenyl-6-methoxyphenol hydroxylase-like FAD-dependent oxidoreductase
MMAIEDGWVLAEHVGSQLATRSAEGSGIDWDAALAAYNAVRPEHCRRVVLTARVWGELWHLDGLAREQRNAVLRDRETWDYSFTDWVYGPTALVPEDEPELYRTMPLEEAAPAPLLVR